MYRVKFILADGRKIYPTDKGRIQTVTQPILDERMHGNLLKHGGYSQDLGIFWLGRPELAPVKIVEIDFEHEASPFDRTAFVLGGRLACQTFQA
jgi:hypothetical protein